MQFGVKYTLTGPYGDIGCFNDTTDPNNIGTLADVTGLDSPEIRENTSDLVEQDGGMHGTFFMGRRPVVLNGLVHGHATATARNAKLLLLKRVAAALRSDSVLRWTWDGMPEMYVSCRLNQPLRITDGWNKTFQLPLVAADPRIYSYALNGQEVTAVSGTADVGASFDQGFDIDFGPAAPVGQLLVTNAGTIPTWPVFTITGPGTNPAIYSLTDNAVLRFNYTLAAGETLVIDALNRTVLLGGSADRYYSLDFDTSEWFPLEPGVNDIRLAFDTFATGAKLRADWRDAWL